MKKTLVRFAVSAALVCLVAVSSSMAGEKPEPLGKGTTIWFDTGGSPGEPFGTIVQNGAVQAAADLGCDLKLLYSDWNPEK